MALNNKVQQKLDKFIFYLGSGLFSIFYSDIILLYWPVS